jgi:DNA-binding GntR family transcriptional regulator
MTTKQRRTTRTDDVHAWLRADILAGRRRPGDRLKFPELCVQFDASVGVIREALTRLEEQGLVHSEAHQGFEVIRLSLDDLNSLTDARVEMEGLVLRRAVQEGDIAWEGAVVSAHHVLERTALLEEAGPSRMSDSWAAAHAAFHEILLNGCGNGRLRALAQSLRDEAELYRRWSVPLGDSPPRDLAAEHQALMEACLARDADLAVARLTAHINRTTDQLTSGVGLTHSHDERALADVVDAEQNSRGSGARPARKATRSAPPAPRRPRRPKADA